MNAKSTMHPSTFRQILATAAMCAAPIRPAFDGGDDDPSKKKPDDKPNENAIAETIRSIVPGMVKSMLQKELATFGESMGKQIGETLKPFAAKVDELAAKVAAPPKGDDDDAPKKKSKKDEPAEPTAAEIELAEMKKKLDTIEKDRRDEKRKLAEHQAHLTDRDAYGRLTSALKSKVAAQLEEVVADHLRARKIVEHDAEGNVKIRVKAAEYNGQPRDEWVEQLMPLDKGLSLYLQSDEAKRFLPAPASGAGGGGRRPPTVPIKFEEANGHGSNGAGVGPNDLDKITEKHGPLSKILG